MQNGKIFILCALMVWLSCGNVFASGSRDSGSYSRPSTSSSSRVNVTYEQGKALFKGRDRRYGKVKYCVTAANGSGLEKVRKRSLKPYAGRSAKLLVDNLYNCDQPDQKIQNLLGSTNTATVVYYLNKRHKLRLTN